jgi:tetratricopeptide (TPR) repeat protein
MEVVHLRNMVGAHINLGEFAEAVALAEQALETHGSEPAIWSYYADALRRTGQVDEAIAALDRVLELDPQSQNVGARQGKWLLDEGRFDEAIPTLHSAVERGEQTPDEVSNMLFNHAYQEGIQLEDWAFAIRALRVAKDFDISEGARQRVDFFLGYAILKDAIIRQEPQTKASAEATLPMFQEARRLLQAAAGYAQGQPGRERDRQALLGNTDTYIQIQEAIIRRGR